MSDTQQLKAEEQKQHILEEIMSDFVFYQHPDLLKKEYSSLLDVSKANLGGIKKYTELFSNLRYAWQKTLKYRLYFEHFYPPTEERVDKIEALNHHIHAYLQDMTILKNKIEVLLGEMKNDINKIASNKSNIDSFCRAGVEKTKEVFAGITEHRDEHHHRGRRFFDGDLLKAENAHSFLETLSNPIVDAMLNQERKPELIAKYTVQREESFEAAKKRCIETAQRNDEQTTGFLETLLKRVRAPLYQFLHIIPAQEHFTSVMRQKQNQK